MGFPRRPWLLRSRLVRALCCVGWRLSCFDKFAQPMAGQSVVLSHEAGALQFLRWDILTLRAGATDAQSLSDASFLSERVPLPVAFLSRLGPFGRRLCPDGWHTALRSGLVLDLGCLRIASGFCLGQPRRSSTSRCWPALASPLRARASPPGWRLHRRGQFGGSLRC